MTDIKLYIKKNIWVWSALGAFFLWLVMGLYANRLNFASLVSNAYAASFLALVAFGQMFVVTSGRGAIDLSIPGVVTLMAFVSMSIINGSDSNVLPAFIVVVGLAVIIGLLNSLMVVYLKIPAIIVTMAMNYILTTAALLINRNFQIFAISPFLETVVQRKLLGIPIIIFVTIALGIAIYFLLTATSYGKSLHAMGQNYAAAQLSGIKIVKIEMTTYILSSVLAAVSGMLISARVGGALLGMGDSYAMETVAAVAVGGTLISGGKASVVGTLIGCLFLELVVTAMQILGMAVGGQRIAKGIIILSVVVIGSFQHEDD